MKQQRSTLNGPTPCAAAVTTAIAGSGIRDTASITPRAMAEQHASA